MFLLMVLCLSDMRCVCCVVWVVGWVVVFCSVFCAAGVVWCEWRMVLARVCACVNALFVRSWLFDRVGG